MKTSVALLLILVTIVNCRKSRRTNVMFEFLRQTIKERTYYLLQNIKYQFGDEEAIQACGQVYQAEKCEKLVLNDIPNNPTELKTRKIVSEKYKQLEKIYNALCKMNQEKKILNELDSESELMAGKKKKKKKKSKH